MRGIASILVVVLGLAAPKAFAGPDDTDCKNAGEQATSECKAASDGATGADNADAGQVGSTVGAKQTINPGANAQQAQALRQVARLNGAKNQCQQKQEECKNKCDQAQKSADAKVRAGQSQTPPCSQGDCPVAKQDQAKIPGTEQNSCIAPIAAMMGKLGDGANAAQNAADQAGKTAGATPGMPPIPPIPPPSPSPDKPQTPTTPTDTAAKDCKTDPNAATNSLCKDQMVTACTSAYTTNSTTSQCDLFTAQFCNATSSSAASTPTDTTTTPIGGGTRPGAGVGSPYCQLAIAHNFCQDPARSQCATCQNYRQTTSPACQADPSKCAQDNSQQQLAASSCPVTEPPLTAPTLPMAPTGGSGSGDRMSGGSGASSGVSTSLASSAAKEGASAGKSTGPNMDMSVDGGGGGGGGGGNDSYNGGDNKSDDPKNGLAGGARASQIRAPNSRTTDVATQSGASLFNISTAAYQNLCANGRLRHCGSSRN